MKKLLMILLSTFLLICGCQNKKETEAPKPKTSINKRDTEKVYKHRKKPPLSVKTLKSIGYSTPISEEVVYIEPKIVQSIKFILKTTAYINLIPAKISIYTFMDGYKKYRLLIEYKGVGKHLLLLHTKLWGNNYVLSSIKNKTTGEYCVNRPSFIYKRCNKRIVNRATTLLTEALQQSLFWEHRQYYENKHGFGNGPGILDGWK